MEEKRSESEILNTTNTGNTTNTTNTDNTTPGNYLPVLLVSCIMTHAEVIFGQEVPELIMKELFKANKPLSFKFLADSLCKDEANIRQAVSRKSEFFDKIGSKGQKVVLRLSQLGMDEISDRINRINMENNRITQEKRATENAQKQAEIEQEKILIFARTFKPNRQGNTIYLDFNELLTFDISLADKLLDKPEIFIENYSKAFSNKYAIKIINIPKSSNVEIENIRNTHINKIIALEGRVVSMSSVRPQIMEIKFECPSCGNYINILQLEKKIREPTRCSCGRKSNFRMINKVLENVSKIIIEDLQEKTDNPHTQRIKAIISGDLVTPEKIKIFTPGNEIRATGIIKEVPIELSRGGISTVLDLAFDIFSAEPVEEDISVENFNIEELNKIKEIGEEIDKNGLNKLASSFAPDIYGYETIKKAICLQLACKKNDPKNKKVRNKPNILLIGDPGVSKSVLCNFAIDITPGSRKAVGGGSSAVGITASVVKEEESMGGYRVEPGALVLAKDILFLDELNNLTEEDKPRLQEGMSEQCVSVNKANLHVKLKVTAGILAAANPKSGTFDSGQDYLEQFNIPSPIINRFDAIFIISDYIDEKKDKAVAKKMIDRERNLISPEYSTDLLRKFFAYVKNQNEPIITDEISERIQHLYSESRRKNNTKVIINARYIEALTRLIKASAKLRLSKQVEEKDLSIAREVLAESHYKTTEYWTISRGEL